MAIMVSKWVLVAILVGQSTDASKTVVVIAALALVALYTLMQNVYYCFLRQANLCSKCSNERGELYHAYGLFYTLTGAGTYFLLCLHIVRSIGSPETDSFVFSLLILAILLLETALDSLILHLACAIVFFCGAVLVLVVYLLYCLCYITCLRYCSRPAPGDSQVRRKELILTLLQDLSVPYSAGLQTASCVICLLNYEPQDIVVILDCTLPTE